MKNRSAAENVRSSNGRTPSSAIRTGGRPTTCKSLTSAGTTSSPSSRSNRAERCPVPEPRSSTGPLLGSQALTCSTSWRARRSMTASNSDFTISRLQQLRRRARLVAACEEFLGEPENPRPEAALQISRVNGECGDTAIQGLKQPSQTVAEMAEKDRKSTRLNSSHSQISYAVFCLKKKKKKRKKV